MKLINKTLVLGSICTVLAACGGSGNVQPVAAAPVPDCTYPDAPSIAAPGWICDEPVEGLAVSAVGTSKISAAGLAFTKNKAAADARRQLAQQMGVEVAAIFKEYVGTTGVAGSDTETVDATAEDIKELFSKQNLTSTRIYKSKTSPEKNLYVLVGVDAEGMIATVNNTLKQAASSMNNENAAWQQFKAKQGHDYLQKRMQEK